MEDRNPKDGNRGRQTEGDKSREANPGRLTKGGKPREGNFLWAPKDSLEIIKNHQKSVPQPLKILFLKNETS